MWGSSESEDKGADLDTLMCLLILAFIVDLRLSTRLFTFLFLLQHEAPGSGLLHRYATATFIYNLSVLHFQPRCLNFHAHNPCMMALIQLFFSFFVLIFTNSVNDDNERGILLCSSKRLIWEYIHRQPKNITFSILCIAAGLLFQVRGQIFLIQSCICYGNQPSEVSCFTYLSKCCTHMYRISVCCTGCLFNTSTYSQPVTICSPASAWIHC